MAIIDEMMSLIGPPVSKKAGDGDSDKQEKHSNFKESKQSEIRPTGQIEWTDDDIGRPKVWLEGSASLQAAGLACRGS